MNIKYFVFIQIVLLLVLSNINKAQDENETCFECHSDKTLTGELDGKTFSVFVNPGVFKKSVHADLGCTSCHADVDPENLPHNEKLQKVDCSVCHDKEAEHYNRSLHGTAYKQGKHLAPTCSTCHGTHDILSPKNEKARTYVMNVPSLCGSCHKEGTAVSKLVNPAERKVLEDYKESIHGEGLLKRGLIVTAVCNSCHTSHDILPHENPLSTINRNNIAKTCMQCHRQIETVHKKVINGQLWEKEPHKIPACIDCHQPHQIRNVFYEDSFPDSKCMGCHSNPNLSKTVNGKKVSLYINPDDINHSVHKVNTCIKCHTNVSNTRNPVCLNSGPVDCSVCHSAEVDDYKQSQHGLLHAQGNEIAPYCTDCHGEHNIKAKSDLSSPTFSRNIPELCGKCHKDGQKAAVAYKGKEHQIIKNYSMSIHGKGLLGSGLVVTATCVDCHTSHKEQPASNPTSTVNRNNIAKTCAKCHLGVYEQFKKSVHSPEVTKTDKKLPVCNDCHFSHTINRVDLSDFRQSIINQCGKCHEDVAETYFDTFHGKVSKLGNAGAAKCFDCHGSHNILPTDNMNSTLSVVNIVNTCKKCHENSNRMFVGYLTHATHHNRDKYPYLFYTFWFMTILLVGTFTFFGLHTLLWLPRGLAERRNHKKNSNPHTTANTNRGTENSVKDKGNSGDDGNNSDENNISKDDNDTGK